MRILVTGAEGFIGSHLVERLVGSNHEVTALVLYNSFNSAGWLNDLVSSSPPNLSVVLGDIRDSVSMQRIVENHEVVIHLASLIAIPYSYKAAQSYIETNVMGTLNVMEAARQSGVKRVIHTSTSEVYGSAQYTPMDEAHPIVGQSPYSASKIGADQIAHSYWASFGLPVTTIRPFNAYGPRQSQRAFIPSVIVQLLSGATTLSLGSLDPTRDLTFVLDTAEGFQLVAESELGMGQVFNMGSGYEVSMGNVVELLFEIIGTRVPIIEDENRKRPKNSEVERLFSDSSKLRNALGWDPKHASIEGLRSGLEATVRWFRDNDKHSGYRSTIYVV